MDDECLLLETLTSPFRKKENSTEKIYRRSHKIVNADRDRVHIVPGVERFY